MDTSQYIFTLSPRDAKQTNSESWIFKAFACCCASDVAERANSQQGEALRRKLSVYVTVTRPVFIHWRWRRPGVNSEEHVLQDDGEGESEEKTLKTVRKRAFVRYEIYICMCSYFVEQPSRSRSPLEAFDWCQYTASDYWHCVMGQRTEESVEWSHLHSFAFD